MNFYIAIASSDEEFESIRAFARENASSRVKCICQEYWPAVGTETSIGNLELCEAHSWLSESEREKVDKKALFFTRNWYKFNAEFEQSIKISGIQLGFVSELAFFNFFKRTLLLLKAVSKAISRENPVAIVATEGTFSSACSKIVSKHLKVKSMELETTPLKKESDKRIEKLSELVQQAAELLKEKSELIKKPNAATVFVKHNGYLGTLPEELRKDEELRVVLLDKIVLRKFLNPLNFWRYLKTKAEQRLFFRKIFADYIENPAFKRQMVFEGMDFTVAFKKIVPRFAERDWPEFVFIINMMLKEFQEKKPKAILLWVDFVPFERICALIAKRFGVKSIVVQHGDILPDSKLKDWLRGYAPLTADKIAVWGPAFKKLLIERSVPSNKIVVTGSLRFNALHSVRATQRIIETLKQMIVS